MLLTQKLKSYYHTESGRSMIEMLGVLAIIGVLSIGGIAGYNYAMIKYKSTETMNEINQRIIAYATQMNDEDLEPDTILNQGGFGDKTALGYRIEAALSEYEHEFNVYLSDVPSDVCVDLLKNYTLPIEISVGDDLYLSKETGIRKDAVSFCGTGTADEIKLAFVDNLEKEPELQDIPVCEWSGWISNTQPDFTKESGDYEPVDGMCEEGSIARISCRATMFPSVPLQELGQQVTCNVENGLVCHNKEQSPGGATPMPYCLNYEINVYCCRERFEHR